MNATTTIPTPGIHECATCEGKGSVWNGRGHGGNDPDSWDIECEDCDGRGHFACEVCGNTVKVDGHDCFVCETEGALPLNLTADDCAVLARSFAVVLGRAS